MLFYKLRIVVNNGILKTFQLMDAIQIQDAS